MIEQNYIYALAKRVHNAHVVPPSANDAVEEVKVTWFWISGPDRTNDPPLAKQVKMAADHGCEVKDLQDHFQGLDKYVREHVQGLWHQQVHKVSKRIICYSYQQEINVDHPRH